MSKRVVVTGIGILSPLGINLEQNWSNIINGKSGISRITRFDISDLPDSIAKIAGEVKYGENKGEFNLENYIPLKEQKKMDRFIHFGIATSIDAIKDSGWEPKTEEDKYMTGVLMGSGIGGLESIETMAVKESQMGMKKISPFFIPQSLVNLTSGHISMMYGYKGPNYSIVSACATSSHSIGEAYEIIRRGEANVMIAGGSEAANTKLGIGGFSAMKALSTQYNDEPERASRPWDRDRDGFVLGEGSGTLVLEDYEHAKKRGAKIYCELAGYGLTGDAYHMTSPDAEGIGAKRAMKMALDKAKLNPEDVDYINAHGTSTPAGDALEYNNVKHIFKANYDKIHMSSTKSATGHLLGGAGVIEAIYCIMAMHDSILPPTLNLENLDENCEGIDLVALKAKEKTINSALSNSFGFGGTNASLIFKKLDYKNN